MKIHYYFLSIMMLNSLIASAGESAASISQVRNPDYHYGVHIGDILEREATLQVEAPYEIAKSALPAKGTVIDGIELVSFQLDEAKHGDRRIYTLKWQYQVFASNEAPSVMRLPGQNIAVSDGQHTKTLQLAAWPFWFAPMVVSNTSLASKNMAPQFGPPRIESARNTLYFSVSALAFLVGIFGWIYANADRKWLPWMGGAFANAHAELKKIPKGPEQERKALAHIHHAFNAVYGINLFPKDIQHFLEAHPSFAKMEADIERFFKTSGNALFTHEQRDGQFIKELVAFSRRLRDCERRVS